MKHTSTNASALHAAADALEAEYLAVANGQKKAAKISLEPMVRAVELLRASTPQADAAIAAGGAQEPNPVTYMTEDEARDWSWKQVKRDVGTEGWTAGDSNNYFGFFCWGWNTRGQYERQRPKIAAPLPRVAATVGLTDEQIIEIGKRHFREGHNPKAVDNFVAAVRDVLAASNGGQA
jgi:hypothetical protein